MEDRPPAERELVARARRGDAVAFAEIVAAHQEIAFRAAYLLLGDAAEAEDAAQEGFVKAYGALDRFRDGEPLRPWLLRIVTNAARNHRRSGVRRAALHRRFEAAERARTEASAESHAMEAEERRAILDAIDGLRADDRLVIVARYFLDLPEREIAAMAQVRPGTVKSRLSRARARLAKALGPGWRGDGDA